MQVEVSFQLSVFGKTSWERLHQMTGWILEPCSERSRTPRFQCLLLETGQAPEWCEGDVLISPGGLWMPAIGQAPDDWRGGSEFSSWPILEGGVLTKYCLSPAQCSHFLALAQRGGLPAAERDRGSVIEAGGRVPILQPFQLYRMRGAAKHGQHTQFRGSFGRAADPFPTLLASGVTPFAFWYADDPAGGCIRFPTEIESERLMGLPDNWTKYGENGELIPSMHRYRALGNSVALPCADYIMAGIAAALRE